MKNLKTILEHWSKVRSKLEKELIEMIMTQTDKYNVSFYQHKYYPCTDQVFRLTTTLGIQYRYLNIGKDGRLYVSYYHGHLEGDEFIPDSSHRCVLTSLSFTQIEQLLFALVPQIKGYCEVFEFNDEFYLHRTVRHYIDGDDEYVKFVEKSWDHYDALHPDSDDWERCDSMFYGMIDKEIIMGYDNGAMFNYVHKNFD